MPAPSPCAHSPRLDMLIVEDDSTIAGNLLDFLAMRGHRPDVAYDGEAAIERLGRDPFDVIVLDLGLPRVDGLDVIIAARQRLLLATPILVLTARDALEARLQAFALGADDYLAKPFALAEVEARALALHRRSTGSVVDNVVEAGELRFDRRTRGVTFRGEPLRLMARSVLLLERLMRRPGDLVERRELERVLWPDGDGTPELLRGQVYLLRKALQEAGHEGLETVHGVGVRLRR
ncbi:MAG: response regulator transcription factor [Burkholderiaceae bacterium]